MVSPAAIRLALLTAKHFFVESRYPRRDPIQIVVVQGTLTDALRMEPAGIGEHLQQRLGEGDFIRGWNQYAHLGRHDVLWSATGRGH
jgi:hypothetical protein